MDSLSQFTNLYPLSKTLRFELVPQGKTEQHIEVKGLLDEDKQRAEAYKKIKKIIDEYHKHFIQLALENYSLDHTLLTQYLDEKDSKKKDKLADKLRADIANVLSKHERYKTISGKELFKGKKGKQDEQDTQAILTDFIHTLSEKQIEALPIKSQQEGIELVKQFESFTTYFGGFHENRKNMYSKEAQGTAIAYRIIHENLPRFLDNRYSFEKIKHSDLKEQFAELEQTFAKPLQELAELAYPNEKNGEVLPLTIIDLFDVKHFSRVITQKGIEAYNLILGGYSKQNGDKVQGLNERINLFNQQQTEKSKRLPKLKILYKQILSDRTSGSFQLDLIENDQELLNALANYHGHLQKVLYKTEEQPLSLSDLMTNISEYDLNHIYLKNDVGLTKVAQQALGSWGIIKEALELDYEQRTPFKQTKTNSREKYQEKRSKALKKDKSYSLGYLNEILSDLSPEHTGKLEHYFSQLSIKELHLINEVEEQFSRIKDLVSTDYPENKKLNQEKKRVENIKSYLDAVKNLQSFIKPLLGAGNEAEKDNQFYGELEPIWAVLNEVTPLYNKARNYLTKKRYSTEKIKLNFQNPTLLNGWPISQEIANSSIILRKEGNYYLGILDKVTKRHFKIQSTEGEAHYEKMMYIQEADPGKSVQNFMVIDGETVKKNGRKSADGINHQLEELKNTYLPQEINEIRKKKSYSKLSDNFEKADLIKFIDFYKVRAQEYYSPKGFQLQFKASEAYENFASFTDHINEQAYQITFTNIDVSFIDEWVEKGQLYLFQIYNKDFSPYSKGTPNLHTLYWKALFDPQNLDNVIYKLNGEAEVFYRKASIDPKENVIHKANEALENKNPANPKKHSTFEYDIAKDRRFTMDKFQFHVPITLNFKHQGMERINEHVNHYLASSDDLHVIGIDRGERHLLYITVVDLQGNIKVQRSLNEIVNHHHGIEHKVNYHTLLDEREKARDEERKSWSTVETIKELKEGYLSQVVHQISQLIMEYNAIVVLEDLNFGFMRGRQKVEKQVYQKFERMLIDKLNYLVDKQRDVNEIGGLYQALQLTNKFESFKKLGKQSGFLFYLPAWMTSKIDPTTGFVNLMDTRYKSVDKAKAFFGNFSNIHYNESADYFEFHIDDYTQFNPKANGKLDWVVCTYGKRIKTWRNPENNNQWDNQEIDLTQEWKALFQAYGISIDSDLYEAFATQTDAQFYRDAMQLMKLTVQLRNSITNTETDYMQSPIKNAQGVFFNSDQATKQQPQDADANGAYNIARKGIMAVEQIKQAKARGEDLGKVKLDITNKAWLAFAQKSVGTGCDLSLRGEAADLSEKKKVEMV